MYHQNFSCSIRRTRHRQSLTELESHLSDESLGSAAYMGTVRLPLVKSDAESTPLRDALKSDLRRRTPEATCRQRMPRTWQHHWHPGPGSIPFLRAALVSSYASGPVSYPAKPSVATRQTAHATCVVFAQRIYCTYPFGNRLAGTLHSSRGNGFVRLRVMGYSLLSARYLRISWRAKKAKPDALRCCDCVGRLRLPETEAREEEIGHQNAQARSVSSDDSELQSQHLTWTGLRAKADLRRSVGL